MPAGRLLALAPCVVFLLLVTSWLGRDAGTAARAPGLESDAARAAACGRDGCGCTEDVSAESCCCAVAKRVASPARAPRLARAPVPPPVTLSAPAHEGTSSVNSFRCSGERRPEGAAAPAPAPAALAAHAPELALKRANTWRASRASSPPGDVEREPRVPPPRVRARA